ncbi:E7 protein [Talpa europaea papillomavirus 1]|uniref:Protein E7 n=1 Tax=Talpa europaea papillomavirus 1 TaxID=1338506 RepID=R9RYR9_9PAPI|nr:E7 protein [Talpa europaea papillomavirus 1]AGM75107.1 E7 protein [Talpa europaea papillomavirus 1]AGM75113.1 E7 protein [Talpa europaea papillomavirus 1]
MIGPEPTLKDITLDTPDSIDLNCYETFEIEEEEVPPLGQPIKVLCYCGLCKRRIKVTVVSDRASLISLESLLVDSSLRFVCCSCGRRYGR